MLGLGAWGGGWVWIMWLGLGLKAVDCGVVCILPGDIIYHTHIVN